MGFVISAALSAVLLSSLSLAQNSSSLAACQAIEQAMTGGIVTYAGQDDYSSETDNYWNVGLYEQLPECVVLPLTTDEVSTAVKTLNQYQDVKFAIKSGGHDPNVGHATAEGGIVISLFWLNGTTYNSDDQTADVKPGGRWSDCITTLQDYGRAVVGGRLGVVGIGGYLSMGGISFLSAQYGLAADVSGFQAVSSLLLILKSKL